MWYIFKDMPAMGKRSKIIKVLAFFCLLTVSIGGVYSQDITWDYGNSSTAWSSPPNWTPTNVPDDPTENVIVDNGGYAGYPVTDNDYTVGDVTLSAAGASITVNAGNTLTVSGNLSVSAGTFSNTNSLVVQGDFSVAAGTFSNTGTLFFDGTTDSTTNNVDLADVEITAGNTLRLLDDLTCTNITINGILDTNGNNLNISGTTVIGAAGKP